MSKHNARLKNQRSDILPVLDSPTFNQTIIINSPRFNINLINDLKRKHHADRRQLQQNRTLAEFNPLKKTLGGIDSWMLNENLKQFGQTRQQLYPQGSEHQKSPSYTTQRIKKAHSTLQHDNIAKQREMSTFARNSPYLPDKTTLPVKSSDAKQQNKARTMDVRKRKYIRDGQKQEPLTPEYPIERRTFRAKKFTPVNLTVPVLNDEDVRRVESQSSQDFRKDAGKSISDIDRSIQKVAEKYFEEVPANRPRNYIEGYISAVKQPAITNTKAADFVSEKKICGDTYDFDFCFDEEAQHQRGLRNFKLQRNLRSRRKQQQDDQY